MIKKTMEFTLAALLGLGLTLMTPASAVAASPDMPEALEIQHPQPLTAVQVAVSLKSNGGNVLQAVSSLTSIGFRPAEIADALVRVYKIKLVGTITLMARARHTTEEIVKSFHEVAHVKAPGMAARRRGARLDGTEALRALPRVYLTSTIGRTRIENASRIAGIWRVFDGDICIARQILTSEMAMSKPHAAAVIALSDKFTSAQKAKRCKG